MGGWELGLQTSVLSLLLPPDFYSQGEEQNREQKGPGDEQFPVGCEM